MKTDRLTRVKELLVSLYTTAELQIFAVQWLGPDYGVVGWAFAGPFAYAIAQELERRGMLRDRVFWDAMVIERPLREIEIREVEIRFASSRIRPLFSVHRVVYLEGPADARVLQALLDFKPSHIAMVGIPRRAR